MALYKSFRFVALATVAAALAACADSGSSSVAPNLEVVDPPQKASGLTKKLETTAPITRSAVIGRKGGWVQIPETGFALYVPERAVKKEMTFTVTALPGKMVAYEFEPHGTTFSQPLYIVQNLDGVDVSGKDMAKFEVGYFKSSTQVNELDQSVTVNEFLPIFYEASHKVLYAPITHFSGYMIATGRRESAD
jgi:hypothetical protein